VRQNGFCLSARRASIHSSKSDLSDIRLTPARAFAYIPPGVSAREEKAEKARPRHTSASRQGADAVRRAIWEATRPVAVVERGNISRHFGAIQAVNDVSLALEAGQVVGLMGDNGAGKSTLVKMIAGNFLPSSGTMKMDGREIVLHRPVDARRHGIEIVHQDLALCNNLTAAANVFLGRELRRGFLLDYQGMYERAGEL